MKLLLFASLEKDRARLERCARGLVRNPEYDAIVSVDELTKELRHSFNSYTIAIIMIAGQEELEKILSIDNLLNGLRTIVIVPDRKPKTMSAALKLHPRYVTYSDSDFMDVSLVANHMIEKIQMIKQSQPHEN